MLGHVSVQTTERYLGCKQQYAKDLGRGKSSATTPNNRPVNPN